MTVVDSRKEIREFLATRQAKLRPQQASIPLYGGRRRVPGLRREEVALLAGVSTDYYARMEKGHVAGVSDDVLDAVAAALNGRPRKTLGWKTPAEALDELVSIPSVPAGVATTP